MNLPTIGWLCSELATDAPEPNLDAPLGPISIDSRTLQAGDTFWALQSQRDGHDFVGDAFAKGAKAAVVHRVWKASEHGRPHRARLIAVEDTRKALTRAAARWRRSLQLPVVGITGSNGKTTTKDLLMRLLSLKHETCGTHGNFNNEIGVPLTVLAIPKTATVAVVEMGASHPGEIGELCAICQPTHGLVTSIAKAHLEGFGSLAEVARTKGQLYDYVAQRGVAFVPTDDELCRAESAHCRHRIGYGFSQATEAWDGEFYQAEELCFDSHGCPHFVLHGQPFDVPHPGRPSALTALSAVTVAHAFGVPLPDCAQAVQSWTGVSGRAEMVPLRDILLIDDSYNANPASMYAALETLASVVHAKRRIAILGDMGELGEYAETAHRELGRFLQRCQVDIGIFVGRYAALAAEEAAGCGVNVCTFEDSHAAASAVGRLVAKGDAVLVKASRSVELEKVVAQLKKEFA